jgi:hypothetical protein
MVDITPLPYQGQPEVTADNKIEAPEVTEKEKGKENK